MTVPVTIFTDVETKVVAALAAVSITCYPYDSRMIDAVPCATLSLGPPHGGVGIGTYNNGAYHIGEISYTFRYYVDAEEGDDGTAQLNLQTGIAKVYQALGADRTLAGACRWSELSDGTVELVPTGDGIATPVRIELMFEAALIVTPHPKA